MEWRVIEEFPNYMVSDEGQIYSLKRNKILKQYLKKGYCTVRLYNKDLHINHCRLVHRLVALAFIPNPNNYPQINHKDENSLNNSKDNLEWCTAKYNSNYGHHKEKLRKSLLNSSNTWKGRHHTPEQIEKMRQAKKGMISPNRKKIIIDGIEYKSYTEAMEKLHICTRKLYKIIREKE